MRVTFGAMEQLSPNSMKKLVRSLDAKEKGRGEYKKMSTTVPENVMKMKALKKMEGGPIIPAKFRDRIDPALLERLTGTSTGFIAPLRAVSPDEQAPTSTPSAVIDTQAAFTTR